MEAEFVNVFIEKQRDLINDTIARCIMLEAKLVLAERQAQKNGELTEELSALNGRYQDMHAQNQAMAGSIENLKATNIQQQETITSLQTQLNKMTMEKEVFRIEADNLKKKVQAFLRTDES